MGISTWSKLRALHVKSTKRTSLTIAFKMSSPSATIVTDLWKSSCLRVKLKLKLWLKVRLQMEKKSQR